MKRIKHLALVALVALGVSWYAVGSATAAKPPKTVSGFSSAPDGAAQVVPATSVIAAAQAPGAEVSGAAPTQAEAAQAAQAAQAAEAGVFGAATPALADTSCGQPVCPTSSYTCWHRDNLWSQWGAWPIEMRITEDRQWCGYYGWKQTYRVSHIGLTSTGLDASGAGAYLYSGGDGYSWATVHSYGHFSRVGFISYNQWQRWSCNVYGNCALVDHS
jgi:hypothetical protein